MQASCMLALGPIEFSRVSDLCFWNSYCILEIRITYTFFCEYISPISELRPLLWWQVVLLTQRTDRVLKSIRSLFLCMHIVLLDIIITYPFFVNILRNSSRCLAGRWYSSGRSEKDSLDA